MTKHYIFGLSLLKNKLQPLAKSVLTPLGLTAEASTAEAAIHEKMSGSDTTTFIILNEEIKNNMKVVKSL